jgi:hypothetical protein
MASNNYENCMDQDFSLLIFGKPMAELSLDLVFFD